MTVTLQADGFERYAGIAPAEAIRLIDDLLDPEDFGTLVELAPLLVGISKDPDLLFRHFSKSVDLLLTSNQAPYTPQSYMLAVGRRAIIRANVWIPMRFAATLRTGEERLFSYRQAHDHNFAFMTVGYFGSGYETDLWEYDPSQVDGILGEVVDLQPLGRERLTQGKVIAFREKADVHTQLPPDELSVSLNIMAVPDPQKVKDQFFFDTDRKCITSMPTMAAPHKRVSIIELAGYIPSDDVVGVLSDLAHEARSWRIRHAAMIACCGNPCADLELKSRIVDRAHADVDVRIRRTADSLRIEHIERATSSPPGGG